MWSKNKTIRIKKKRTEHLNITFSPKTIWYFSRKNRWKFLTKLTSHCFHFVNTGLSTVTKPLIETCQCTIVFYKAVWGTLSTVSPLINSNDRGRPFSTSVSVNKRMSTSWGMTQPLCSVQNEWQQNLEVFKPYFHNTRGKTSFELRTRVDTSNCAKKMMFFIVQTSVTERKKTHEHNLFFDIKKTVWQPC